MATIVSRVFMCLLVSGRVRRVEADCHPRPDAHRREAHRDARRRPHVLEVQSHLDPPQDVLHLETDAVREAAPAA